MRSLSLLLVMLALPAVGYAQDRIFLHEILPALEGSDLGDIDVGPAPPPGSTRSVRRSEVLAALRNAGREARGLAIPQSTRVSREARRVENSELEQIVMPAVEQAVAPCNVETIGVPSQITLPAGEVTAHAEQVQQRRSGTTTVIVTLDAPGRETRLPVRAAVTCPPPVVSPGSQVRIVARVGQVRASAPGEARQPGRVGDLIRVNNRITRSTLVARVVSAEVVEVVQ